MVKSEDAEYGALKGAFNPNRRAFFSQGVSDSTSGFEVMFWEYESQLFIVRSFSGRLHD
jgi:hypothetical protein